MNRIWNRHYLLSGFLLLLVSFLLLESYEIEDYYILSQNEIEEQSQKEI